MSLKKKIIIVAVILVVAIAALVISGLRGQKTSENPTEAPVTENTAAPIGGSESETNEPVATEQVKEEKEKNAQTAKPEEKAEAVTPEHDINVMYLISNSNENKEELLKMAEELRKEYEAKVYFTVMNIDENEMGANFALPDETPKLVMFGENNLFEMKNNCSDKEELKKIIDAALNK